ncbi:MAG: hypothetical protein U5O39_14345 [Gammaproteobacteria bacterium]|nr:hypothetical protein [Gammaproteobacteria bacterium]
MLEEQPGNLSALEGAAMLSMEFGMADMALELSRALANAAVASSEKKMVQQANENITRIHQRVPPWVNDALDAASHYEGGQEAVVEDRRAITRESGSAPSLPVRSTMHWRRRKARSCWRRIRSVPSTG